MNQTRAHARKSGARLLGLITALGCSVLSSCGPSREQIKAEQALKSENQRLQIANFELNQKLSTQKDQTAACRAEVRRAVRERLCKRKDITTLLNDLENCQELECPKVDLDRLAVDMLKFDHVVIRLVPSGDLSVTVRAMAPARRQQLRQLLAASKLTPGSRMVTIALALGFDDRELAYKTAREIEKFLHEQYLAPSGVSVPELGPFPILCSKKSNLIDRLSRNLLREDKRVLEEPQTGQKQIVVLVYRLEC